MHESILIVNCKNFIKLTRCAISLHNKNIKNRSTVLNY